MEKRTDEYKRKYQIDKNTYVIAACSRIVEEKGVIQLQNAFKKMKEKYKIKNTKLLIIGSILPKTDYINQVLNNVDDDMLFTDYVSHSEMPAILAMADIVVTPTVHLLKKYKGKDYIGVQEGLNLTIIEALSLGIPVVASNSGGMVEILDNQKIGCVISAREDLMVVELPDVLYHYYLNPADTNVKQACILAAQKYSQEKYVQTYERYINKVLNG